MPVVKRPGASKEVSVSARRPTVSIEKPTPPLKTLISLITSLLQNKKVVYLRLNSSTINYEYLPDKGDILSEETHVDWYLKNRKKDK